MNLSNRSQIKNRKTRHFRLVCFLKNWQSSHKSTESQYLKLKYPKFYKTAKRNFWCPAEALNHFISVFQVTMFPPIACLLTRYPCQYHSHTTNNPRVYVIYNYVDKRKLHSGSIMMLKFIEL